ncbi:hypothetical protein GCM10018781_29560 [Kitasatospora indigofera]|uniref:Uncharacterized protein n=1 Tax=Kitasatospora indigofera TaxID=67307 RepID=A0A919FQP8_9ACTN|nr:hypothetical protein GCM10018781_29560 [Kitasatospora indigofera]
MAVEQVRGEAQDLRPAPGRAAAAAGAHPSGPRHRALRPLARLPARPPVAARRTVPAEPGRQPSNDSLSGGSSQVNRPRDTRGNPR